MLSRLPPLKTLGAFHAFGVSGGIRRADPPPGLISMASLPTVIAANLVFTDWDDASQGAFSP